MTLRSKPTRTPEQAREYMREYRQRPGNRERIRKLSRESNKRMRESRPEKFMLHNARQRARVRGQPCTISLADIHIPAVCPLLATPLKVNSGVLGPDSPSLDRLDPSLGYIPGNVWVISHRANSMKNDAGPEELVQFARRILEVFDAET